MAAESHARSLESSDFSNDRIELEGLESVFVDDNDELFSKGLTLKQAVFYYGETRKSLKSKVVEGSIPAIRLPESHGKKWRVFPDGVPPQLQSLIPKKLRKASQEAAREREYEEEDDGSDTVALEAVLEQLKTEPYVADSVLDLIPDPGSSTETGQSPAESSTAVLVVAPMESTLTTYWENRELKENQGIALSQGNSEFQVFAKMSVSNETETWQTILPKVDETVGTSENPQAEALDNQSSSSEVYFDFSPPQLIDFSPKLVEMEQTAEAAPVEPTPPPMPVLDTSGELASQASPGTSEAVAPQEPNKRAVRYNQLQDKIHELEKQLVEASHRNSYLETRLNGLEDQIKFLTQSHYQSRSFNKMMLLIPGLALLVAIIIFKLSGQMPL